MVPCVFCSELQSVSQSGTESRCRGCAELSATSNDIDTEGEGHYHCRGSPWPTEQLSQDRSQWDHRHMPRNFDQQQPGATQQTQVPSWMPTSFRCQTCGMTFLEQNGLVHHLTLDHPVSGEPVQNRQQTTGAAPHGGQQSTAGLTPTHVMCPRCHILYPVDFVVRHMRAHLAVDAEFTRDMQQRATNQAQSVGSQHAFKPYLRGRQIQGPNTPWSQPLLRRGNSTMDPDEVEFFTVAARRRARERRRILRRNRSRERERNQVGAEEHRQNLGNNRGGTCG